jgi:hypothetical protein
MMAVMVKEADLYRLEVPKDFEVLDATALGRRLGFKRDKRERKMQLGTISCSCFAAL